MMRVAVGADSNGRALTEVVKAHWVQRGHEVVDFGVGPDQDVGYPE